MRKLLIFDIDGTVLDTLKTIRFFLNQALEKNGHEGIDLIKVREFIGNGASVLVHRTLKYIKGDEGYTKDEFNAVFDDYNLAYNSNVEYLTEAFPGVVELIKDLKAKGYLVCAISNKPHDTLSYIMGPVLEKDLFDYYLGQSDRFNKKPDPEMIYALLDKYEVAKKDAFMIGDSEVDIRTGKNAGINTIAVGWGYRDLDLLEAEGPDVIVHDSEELSEKILNFGG